MCTLLLLSQLNPSSLPGPQPDFRISLCASCLCSVPPTSCPVVHALSTTSTRFPPIGTCSDLTATPKQNSGQTHLSPTTSSKPLGARIDTCENHLLFTPRPVQLLLSLCVWEARTSCFLGLHRAYFFSTVTPEITKLSLARTRPIACTPPRACPVDARCDVQPHPHPRPYTGPTQRATLTTDRISPPATCLLD